MFRNLDHNLFVAGQIAPDDLLAAKELGVTTVINNRPDREEPGQPAGDAIAAAAQEAGLDYHAIPVGHGGMGPTQVAAMNAAIEGAAGGVLAFCRSGTRSTYLWALARAGAGDDPAVLTAKAHAAGYDLSPLGLTRG